MSKKVDIGNIDVNVAAKSFSEDGFKFYEVRNGMFEINGFPFLEENDNEFLRLPKRLKEEVGERVWELASNNSGGMIRFMTNSKRLAVKCKIKNQTDMNHFPRSAMNGVDIYVGNGDKKKFRFNVTANLETDTASEMVDLDVYPNIMTEITLYMPLYNHVLELYVGVEEDAVIERAVKMAYETPIVFYGSSITQGACASRVGLCYTNMLSRWLDAKIINFGFSGQATGQLCIAEEIGKLKSSLFVMDYDHNAPDPKFLEETHYPFYKKFREFNKETPIIFISKPDPHGQVIREARKRVIKNTYLKALEEGDTRVIFVDGEEFMGEILREYATVDTIHPNDLGFYLMVQKLYPIIKDILNR